ncbi:hypothetical protein SAMN05421595_1832 [Austwickia chelonae]|uniref:Uncharacterized protein n=1 Tax=Austwickia chelonae NBRC 105200 TaxID=1184607 RepID=K6VMU7_9MICO|nr:hypothetical protein [Austwickia chelonae]GAB76700.1 hypothetical protein AUCHE_02_00610 [Austwickia chelonae NBRC 105200]SEW29472.1 hypothetical protein SAMN05421595_1832 [Austwickia chelonae]
MNISQRVTVLLLAAVLVVGGAVWFVERSTRPGAGPPSPGASSSSPESSFGPYPRFAPGSVFTQELTSAPVDQGRRPQVELIARHVRDNWGGIAALNVDDYAAGFAVASSETPRVDVLFHDCQRKGGTPAGLYDGAKHFVGVPIPDDAVPASASDGHLAVWDRERDILWEFWVASRRPDGRWQACWGGRIDRVSQADGRFPAPFGASAAGLAASGYMVTLEEARRLQIDHAMGLVVMEAGRGHHYPANRDDGTSARPEAVKEGTRLRLDPSVDVDSSSLTPLGKAIARAAQKYGFIVVDKGGAVAVMAESGGRHRAATGRDPWADLGRGTPAYQVLRGFPWDRLHVVEPGWGAPG